MNLRHLEFVVGVAEHGGFRKAAGNLHVSQSALSHAITTIERRLGAPLFHRLGRGITLTPVGETYVSAARRVLEAHSALESATCASNDLTDAVLPITLQATGVTAGATRLIAAMRREHPGVRIEVSTQPTPSDVHRELLTGRCEVGISDWASHRALETEPLFEERFVLVCPPGTDVPSSVMSPADRFPTAMILPPGWQAMRAANEHVDGYDFTNPVAVEAQGRDLMLSLVLAGVGSALMSEVLADAAGAAGAVVITLDPPLTRTVLLVRRPGRLDAAAEAFVTCARAERDRERDPERHDAVIDESDQLDRRSEMDMVG